MDLVKIGSYIAEKRKALGLTQKQLAEKLNMSDKSVSKWERGICLPDVSIYMELCSILRISINEFLALHKPMLLIPLPAEHSRGDQLDNAEEFERRGYAKKMLEEEITADSLVCEIKNLFDERRRYAEAMEKSGSHLGREKVFGVIMEVMEKYPVKASKAEQRL